MLAFEFHLLKVEHHIVMDNSNPVTDDIYPNDGISNCTEKDLPASQSTADSNPDGDDDERNSDHQTDSSDEVTTNVSITIHSINYWLSSF